ncbi:MAG: AAA family ATPase [Methanoregula sp.]|jgi:exonuclease SbcC|uniref:AAA family ATPase n=1 Tax=Methanoregula sp. TaxID=2052170 RepID=UPI0025FB53D9|nr:AAA family ATPase [Methanoregula sp.]MCK9632596.1 AAA family ATPase [Methanoregula sp.]
MRILSLRFKNLNSLAGEWKIDFTDPEYISSGIFAITGPTGAGKSTILDALCLALYGHTPRLGKISSNAGELMSLQTGEYFSEVEFESDKGHFRCMWSQRRADKKPDGKLQPSKHEIVDVKTGVPLESKQVKVQEKVIAVTGLDYQQFTRSILLAQGDFDKFLDSKSDERGTILEKVTGTEIYGEISIKVHERFGLEKARLDELKARVDTVGMMTPEQAEAFRNEKREHEKKILEISANLKCLEDATAWLGIIATLETEISDLQRKHLELTTQKEASRKDLDTLHLARKARDLEGIYSGLSTLRVLQEKEITEKKLYEVELGGFCVAYTNVLHAFQIALEHQTIAVDEKQKEDELIKRVRDLDGRIRETLAKRDEREKEKRQAEEEREKYKQAIQSAESQLKDIRPSLSNATAYLGVHPRDQKLIESLSGIESAIRQIHGTEETAEKKRRELHEVENVLADAEQIVFLRKTEQDNVAKKVMDIIAELSRAKKEFAEITGNRDIAELRVLADRESDRRNHIQLLLDLFSRLEEDTAERGKHAKTINTSRAEQARDRQRYSSLQKELEKVVQLVKVSEKNLLYIAQIKSYEEARKTLHNGAPCPLCGSTDHPLCAGIEPETDDAQKKYDEYKKEGEELQKNLRHIEVEFARYDAEIRAGESSVQGLVLKIRKATSDLDDGCRDLGLSVGNNPKPAIATALVESTKLLQKTRETLIRAEEKGLEIQKGESQVGREKDVLAEIQREYEKVLSIRDEKARDKERLIKEIAATDAEFKRQNATLLESIQEYDIIIFNHAPIADQILTALTDRRDRFVENLSRCQDLQNSLQQCEAMIEKNRSLLLVAEKSFNEISEKLTLIDEDFKKYSADRKKLYNEKDPSVEEARVIQIVEKAEGKFAAATDAKNLVDKQKNTCEEQIKALAAKISARLSVLEEKELQYSSALTGAGFSNEESFLSARLPPNRLTALEKLEKDIVREETEIDAGLKERTVKLTAERERSLTQEKREDLAIAIDDDKARMDRLRIDIGRIQLQLEQYDEQVEKQKVLTEEIIKQKKEFVRWQKLNELIGSANGKKFKVFAQGLTFKTLMVQANRHLRAMSEHRYLLIQNKESPLDLDIIDNYQAGEIRTTKNLSGGERFLVSLALALGLSGMASHNVRIDSLFLDEGFGALDEDTLETALKTLSSFQREGKIIGMISHVTTLKERIPIQIQVEKIGSGRSRLYGPGCSNLR